MNSGLARVIGVGGDAKNHWKTDDFSLIMQAPHNPPTQRPSGGRGGASNANAEQWLWCEKNIEKPMIFSGFNKNLCKTNDFWWIQQKIIEKPMISMNSQKK